MTLLDLEHVLSNLSFACLLAMVVWYWLKLSFSLGARFTKIGTIGMATANVSLTGLLTVRWISSGHFPLSNLYESLLFLSWGLTAFHLITEGLTQTDLVGLVTSPVALLVNGFASFSLPKEMQKATALIPALQSNWLMMHVTVMMISYVALIAGSLLSIGFLVINYYSRKDRKDLGTDSLNLALSSPDQVFASQSQPVRGRGGAGALSQAPYDNVSEMAVTATTQVRQGVDPLVFFTAGRVKPGASTSQELVTERALSGCGVSPQTVVFINPSINSLKDLSVLAQTLDNLSYRALGLGFPLLTIGILSGAVWANEAWGSYWSWDPKETWALITWLVFAIYLHTRLNRGWRGNKPALIAATGFLVVWICYLGVNMLGTGLHSYGWFRGAEV